MKKALTVTMLLALAALPAAAQKTYIDHDEEKLARQWEKKYDRGMK